jgi:hypothetical protein
MQCIAYDSVVVKFEFPRHLVLIGGVILSVAVFQAKRRISCLPALCPLRSLTRLKCAGFRDDAF